MRMRHAVFLAGVILALLLIGIGIGFSVADSRARAAMRQAAALTGGDPSRGPGLARAYGCIGCHTIPGVHEARGLVGPPLQGILERAYVAGVAANTPDNLTQWIMHPRQFSPRTAMPDLGVSEKDARDLAAFLYTR